MRILKFNTLFLIAIFLIFGGFLFKGLDLGKKSEPMVNQPVPSFNLPALLNKEHRLTDKVFAGKVTIATVWASWCSCCKSQHQLMMDVAKEKKLFLVGVNFRDDEEQALNTLKALGNPYTINIVDKEGRLGLDWGIYGTPETFVIDKNGIVRYRHIGPINQAIWNKNIKPLVAKLEK